MREFYNAAKTILCSPLTQPNDEIHIRLDRSEPFAHIITTEKNGINFLIRGTHCLNASAIVNIILLY